jgi:CheY-like chemotaxis protein
VASVPGEGMSVEGLRGARILVVEDTRAMRDALIYLLSRQGADVRAAASAAQAITTFTEFRPELLVCDISMPIEDGYSLLARIRAFSPEQGSDVPAVALTSFADEDDRRRALAAGFQVHMAKPVDIDGLVAALTRLRRAPRA